MPGVYLHLTEPAFAVYKGLVANKAASKTVSRLLMQYSIDLQESRQYNREQYEEARKILRGEEE